MLKNIIVISLSMVLFACDQKSSTVEQTVVEQDAASIAVVENSQSEKTAAPAATTYAPSEVEMELKQVSDHVWFAQGATGIATDNEGFISNASVVIGDKGIVVVDALGTPSLAHLLLSKIRQISDKPILKVIATHYHADHIYGLQVFQDEGAEVLAPYGVDQYLDSPQAAERLDERRFSLEPWVNENTRLVVPDRMIDATEAFDIGGTELVISYLGRAHSDGDLSVYVNPDRVLISGDIIFEGRVPFVGDANTKEWLEVLNRMGQQQMKALIPGHGDLANDPNAVVSLMRDYLQALRGQMGNAVEEMMSFDEAYGEASWKQFEHIPAFQAANRINAYQVFLSLEAELLGQ